MTKMESFNDYLTKTYLIALFVVVGTAAAVTALLAMWPPLAYLASKFFG